MLLRGDVWRDQTVGLPLVRALVRIYICLLLIRSIIRLSNRLVRRRHVEKAVARKQQLQVFYFEGMTGKGKIKSWEACKDDAIRRDTFWPRMQAFLQELPAEERARLDGLSSKPRDDSKGKAPGSERGDEEHRLFMASLSEEDRRFLQRHEGLGNSQKLSLIHI